MSVLALATSAICVNAFLPPNSANMKHMDRRDGPGKRKVSRKAPIFENTTRSYHLKGVAGGHLSDIRLIIRKKLSARLPDG